MNSPIKIFKVTVQLEKDEYGLEVSHWRLLVETNRYYEIKPESGPVKRIYKEKLNTVVDDTKSYTDGYLACSAFCNEDRIDDMHTEMLHALQLKIKAYMDELHLNQQALELQFNRPKPLRTEEQTS
ncbi:hypothetical protein C173_31516 [Paenibacillus sp. FSL R7-277]|uniref:hypothetical protein n=1 Tax=unclassified Paenibacillus TaxID=185978 RepID=UPI0003E29E38|nr:hypothetical protein [Paenibacillus sp. FSL R7-277]ETT57695.1 hypothetical protein C173_31516 [Paenibacillus sp. FSL R7-277]